MKPLAYRMRPTQLSEVVGQKHLVGPGQIIDRMITAKMLSSMILYGPQAQERQVLPQPSPNDQICLSYAKCRD